METRSKKTKSMRKEITAAEYEKMTKVRVSLDRLNRDMFQKTGRIILTNEKGTENNHVSIFHGRNMCVRKFKYRDNELSLVLS